MLDPFSTGYHRPALFFPGTEHDKKAPLLVLRANYWLLGFSCRFYSLYSDMSMKEWKLSAKVHENAAPLQEWKIMVDYSTTTKQKCLKSGYQAFRNDSKERNEKVTIPFFSKGTERNEEQGEI